MHLVEEPHGEDVADDAAVLARDEVVAPAAAQLRVEELAPPRVREGARLEVVDLVDVGREGGGDVDGRLSVGAHFCSLTSASASRT